MHQVLCNLCKLNENIIVWKYMNPNAIPNILLKNYSSPAPQAWHVVRRAKSEGWGAPRGGGNCPLLSSTTQCYLLIHYSHGSHHKAKTPRLKGWHVIMCATLPLFNLPFGEITSLKSVCFKAYLSEICAVWCWDSCVFPQQFAISVHSLTMP